MKTIQNILFILCTIPITSDYVFAQDKLTPAQLTADFSLLKQVLKESHPGLYRYNTPARLDSLFIITEGLLNHEMTQQEFYQILIPLMTQIKCGHTKLHPENNWSDNYYYHRDNLFPLKLYFKDDKAYFLDGYVNRIPFPKGSEIISINNKPVSEIIHKLLPAFFSDGNNETFKYLELGKFFSAYYANLIEAPDSFVIAYRTEKNIFHIRIPAIAYSAIDQYEKQQESNSTIKEPYYLEFKENHTALLTIKSFWEDGKDSYKSFLRNSFMELRDKGIEHLIIDLRNNEGGRDKRGALLLSYIMDRKFKYYDRLEVTTKKKYTFADKAYLPKFFGLLRMLISKTDSGTFLWKHNKNLRVQKISDPNFTGNVYVLINGGSFSVTAEFAAVTHYLKRATFIGEETGGGYYGNNSGTFVIVPLTHSRLIIGVPMLAYYVAVKNYAYPDRGLLPDYTVKSSVHDIIEEKDAVMDFTLQLIKQKIVP